MLCAKWIILFDGCVARCDLKHNHVQENHVDSVIALSFTQDDIDRTRRFLNLPGERALRHDQYLEDLIAKDIGIGS